MTATMNAFPVSKTISPAVDAFDIEAVCKADLASAKVVDIAGKYEIEFDTEVTLSGRQVDVKVLYANNIGEIDVYRLNDDADPVEPEMSHWLSAEDYERVFGDAEEAHFEKEAEDAEAARLDYEDRKCHEYLEARACGNLIYGNWDGPAC